MKDKGTLIRLRRCAQVADVKPNESVLDLGCGDSYIKNYLPAVNYVGIDQSRTDICHDLEKGLPATVLEQRFDVVFLNEFIEHIENFRSLLIQCRNILTSKGRIIVSTPSANRIMVGEDPTHIHCFRKTNMHNLARICNLKIEKAVGTYIRVPPISPLYLAIPTHQTFYTEVVVYKLLHDGGM